ncbi:hypothetical protein AALO_G00232760 [Alosa alosa]|uniref:Angiotensinogen n=1 Tax=Alosa alosa TaxID=278164 RepID=A0AAV6FUV6_9TELE|nr:angiotensinogen [Alosa sapidissima]XP_048125811.1 angiotensinogen [Alosa alosa]KAG5266498.1 hypothetical protein AALO_G00232760 [Alosa alosa]
MREAVLSLVLVSCLALSLANRVYVHPFGLFALGNISCEVIQSNEPEQVEVVKATPIGLQDNTAPDLRDLSNSNGMENSTQRKDVLAELQNILGLRMYKVLTNSQKDSNTLYSPVNVFGTLVTLYLGASKKTAVPYQQLLGIYKETETENCVYLIDGHMVLRTLQEINALIDGPRDELRTLVWSFITEDGEISKDFVRGAQDFSDASYTRSVDFTKPEDAEKEVNSFIQKTSDGDIKEIFQNLSSTTNFLFASSVHFKGNWRTAFQPEATSMQDFKVDEETTVSVPLMTHTGEYKYLNDKGRKCTVVKLGLSMRTYMLLVLPYEGASLQDIESQLQTEVLSKWYQHLKEGYLELSLPKFSLTGLTDLKSLLTDMNVEEYLLGSKAQFQRLSNKEKFTVDKVFSKVVFEMSEEGSQVSNKTEDGRVPLKLTVNRPFLFAIVEGNSNAILMLGKIINPAV